MNIVTLVDFVVNQDIEPERAFPGCRVVPQVGAPDRRRQERRLPHAVPCPPVAPGRVVPLAAGERSPATLAAFRTLTRTQRPGHTDRQLQSPPTVADNAAIEAREAAGRCGTVTPLVLRSAWLNGCERAGSTRRARRHAAPHQEVVKPPLAWLVIFVMKRSHAKSTGTRFGISPFSNASLNSRSTAARPRSP